MGEGVGGGVGFELSEEDTTAEQVAFGLDAGGEAGGLAELIEGVLGVVESSATHQDTGGFEGKASKREAVGRVGFIEGVEEDGLCHDGSVDAKVFEGVVGGQGKELDGVFGKACRKEVAGPLEVVARWRGHGAGALVELGDEEVDASTGAVG